MLQRHLAISLLFVTILAAPLGAAGDTTTWAVDPGHSSAGFTVRHLVISNVKGYIPIKSATIVTTGDSMVPSTLAATLDATAINTQNSDRDSDLRGADWLEVNKFPTITFKSTSVMPGDPGSFKASGDLTIHGVTKSVVLAGKVEGSTTDAKGHRHVGYSASTTLDRRDFALNWANKTPGGDLIAGNDVAIDLEIEAIAQP